MDIYMHRHTHAAQYNVYMVSIYLASGSVLVVDEMTHSKRKCFLSEACNCNTQDMKEASSPGGNQTQKDKAHIVSEVPLIP